MGRMKYYLWRWMFILCLLIAGCEGETNYAPVTDANPIDPIPPSGMHQATKNETLYEIAWRYGLDYRVIARNSRILPPYRVHKGQIVRLRTLHHADRAKMVKSVPYEQDLTFSIHQWRWPIKGRVIKLFSTLNKGLNIAGREGESVRASASGKVVYASNGLRGYGNLVIIKHNSLYLSAYAQNKKLFVKEGEWVKQGQIIGELGKTNLNHQPILHFEIRQAGKPVDPMPLLSA